MHAHEHTTVWGTHLGIGRTTNAKRWYQHLRDWWTTHRAARLQATPDVQSRGWDARRETVTSGRADAACDIVAAHGPVSMAAQMYGLL
jgi:hypothetical protein